MGGYRKPVDDSEFVDSTWHLASQGLRLLAVPAYPFPGSLSRPFCNLSRVLFATLLDSFLQPFWVLLTNFPGFPFAAFLRPFSSPFCNPSRALFATLLESFLQPFQGPFDDLFLVHFLNFLESLLWPFLDPLIRSNHENYGIYQSETRRNSCLFWVLFGLSGYPERGGQWTFQIQMEREGPDGCFGTTTAVEEIGCLQLNFIRSRPQFPEFSPVPKFLLH